MERGLHGIGTDDASEPDAGAGVPLISAVG